MGRKMFYLYVFSFNSVAQSCPTLQPHGLQHTRPPCPSPTPKLMSKSLLKLMSIELVMPSNHLILCRPLLLPPSIFHSISVFSNESVLRIRWPTYWSFPQGFYLRTCPPRPLAQPTGSLCSLSPDAGTFSFLPGSQG